MSLARPARGTFSPTFVTGAVCRLLAGPAVPLCRRRTRRLAARPSVSPCSVLSRGRRIFGESARHARQPTSSTTAGNPHWTRSADARNRAVSERQRVTCSQVGRRQSGRGGEHRDDRVPTTATTHRVTTHTTRWVANSGGTERGQGLSPLVVADRSARGAYDRLDGVHADASIRVRTENRSVRPELHRHILVVTDY
jgi:hypothetical protein